MGLQSFLVRAKIIEHHHESSRVSREPSLFRDVPRGRVLDAPANSSACLKASLSFFFFFLICFFLHLSLSLFIGQCQGKRDFLELLAVSCMRETPCHQRVLIICHDASWFSLVFLTCGPRCSLVEVEQKSPVPV